MDFAIAGLGSKLIDAKISQTIRKCFPGSDDISIHVPDTLCFEMEMHILLKQLSRPPPSTSDMQKLTWLLRKP